MKIEFKDGEYKLITNKKPIIQTGKEKIYIDNIGNINTIKIKGSTYEKRTKNNH